MSIAETLQRVLFTQNIIILRTNFDAFISDVYKEIAMGGIFGIMASFSFTQCHLKWLFRGGNLLEMNILDLVEDLNLFFLKKLLSLDHTMLYLCF